MKIEHACPKCGKGRWKTVQKRMKYRCRNCGLEKNNEVEIQSINIVGKDDKPQGEILKVETK